MGWSRDLLRSRVEELVREPGRLSLMLVGIVCIGMAFVVRRDTGFAVTALLAGAALVLASGALPWIKHLGFGPHGVKMDLHQRAIADSAAQAAVESPASDSIPDEPTFSADEQAGYTNWIVADEMLPILLRPVDGPLGDASFHLFIYDVNEDRLLPTFEPDDGLSEGWRIGHGATGLAYESGRYVSAAGADVTSPDFGLTPDQAERYKDLVAVAAMPVTNSAGDVIAVLAGDSTDPDTQLLTDEGFEEHLLLAQKVSRILIDLLGWFADA